MSTQPSNRTGMGNSFRAADSLVSVELVNEWENREQHLSWRFGIGSIFVCMFVFSIQFALVANWGLLGGCLLAPALIMVGMAALAIVELIPSRGNRTRRERERFSSLVTYRFGLYLVLLLVSGYMIGGAQLVYRDFFLKRRVKRALGFNYHTSSVWHDGQIHELIVIDSLVPGKPMHLAGFQKGDAIVSELSEHQFVTMLDESRGQTVTVTIERGRTLLNLDLDESRQFEIELVVPP